MQSLSLEVSEVELDKVLSLVLVQTLDKGSPGALSSLSYPGCVYQVIFQMMGPLAAQSLGEAHSPGPSHLLGTFLV